MQTVTEFPYPILDEDDIGIVLSDGCRLSARLWRPEDAAAGPVPAILEYIPYRKRDGTLPRDELMHPYVAGHGYACLRVDMRGNGDSQGLMADEYTAQELADAVEVIAWAARQPWCSGAVGMMGKSWGGFNALQVAALDPPALKAIITVCSTTDRFADDIHFKGGCLLNENLAWAATMLSYSSRPPDPALAGADWRAMWIDRLEANPFLAPRWAGHQARDAYWRHGSVCEDWSAIRAAVLAVGGWADGYMNTVAHLVENLPGPVKGIVGPWVHQYPHTAVPGPAIGFLQEALRWWDHWLKGAETGVEADPAYRVWMQHSMPPARAYAHRAGHWVAETALPSARVARRNVPLSPGGLLGGSGGRLGARVQSPQTAGFQGGEYFPMSLNPEMPGDQRADDALCLCFDMPALADPLDLLGAPELRLRLSSDRPLGLVAARLCDVAPDGASTRITHGYLNLCHRDSRESPFPVTPGAEIEVTVRLDHLAQRIAAGHRLRLALSNASWPFLWPSPEAGTLTIAEGALSLPVHSGSDGDEWRFAPPEAAPGWRHTEHRAPSYRRRIEEDLVSGGKTLAIDEDGGIYENLRHGLVTGWSTAERWSIRPDDPLSASGECLWEQTLGRGDWQVRTRAECAMTADRSEFRFTGRLTAWEGDRAVFDRHFKETVPRLWV